MSQPQRIEPIEAPPPPKRDPAIDATIRVLELVFGPPYERSYDIRLWDGTVQHGGADPRADFALYIRRPSKRAATPARYDSSLRVRARAPNRRSAFIMTSGTISTRSGSTRV